MIQDDDDYDERLKEIIKFHKHSGDGAQFFQDEPQFENSYSHLMELNNQQQQLSQRVIDPENDEFLHYIEDSNQLSIVLEKNSSSNNISSNLKKSSDEIKPFIFRQIP